MPRVKGFYLLVNFCFIYGLACARNSPVLDSLLACLPASNSDTSKVNLLNRIAYEYTGNYSDSGVRYAEEAVGLATSLAWTRGIMLSKKILGRIYWYQKDFKKALTYHKGAIRIAEQARDKYQAASIAVYLGQDYGDDGQYREAMNSFNRARAFYESAGDPPQLANVCLLISWVHSQQGNYPGSSKANMEALRIFESIKDEYGAAVASANIAADLMTLGKHEAAIPYVVRSSAGHLQAGDYVNVAGDFVMLADAYSSLARYSEALKYAMKGLGYGRKINDAFVIGQAYEMIAGIYFKQDDFDKSAPAFRDAIASYRTANSAHSLSTNYSRLGTCYVRLHEPARAKAALDSAAYFEEQLESSAVLSEYLSSRQLYDSLTGNWKEAYLNHYKYVSIRDSIYNAEASKKLLQSQVQYEFDKREAASKAEQDKKDTRQRTIRNSIMMAFGGVLIFSIVVYRQRNKISKARKRSDELLLNILPGEVAEELREKGSADAKQFDEVTVMFKDFKGFTQISEKLTPKELVQEIHYCFKAFDDIISSHGIEKIKTIGDSYMCAGGLPVVNTTHPEAVVAAALEIREFMRQHVQERRRLGQEVFEIRIGIHTGPVVAGIVGVKKFAYDIWGDTVNIASRMESSGEAGRINISGSSYELVKDRFRCEHRGKIAAKNKGEIDMYFVEEAIV